MTMLSWGVAHKNAKKIVQGCCIACHNLSKIFNFLWQCFPEEGCTRRYYQPYIKTYAWVPRKQNRLLSHSCCSVPIKIQLISLSYKPVCLPQLFYCRGHHSSGSASATSALIMHKIAVGKREAVAFKYRLKCILSCWYQPALLSIPL